MRPTVSAHDGRAEQDQEGKHRGIGHTRGANQSIPPMHGSESAFHDHSMYLAPAGWGGPEPGMTKQARESLDHIRPERGVVERRHRPRLQAREGDSRLHSETDRSVQRVMDIDCREVHTPGDDRAIRLPADELDGVLVADRLGGLILDHTGKLQSAYRIGTRLADDTTIEAVQR
jgi:hypothetical protein